LKGAAKREAHSGRIFGRLEHKVPQWRLPETPSALNLEAKQICKCATKALYVLDKHLS